MTTPVALAALALGALAVLAAVGSVVVKTEAGRGWRPFALLAAGFGLLAGGLFLLEIG